VGVIGIERHTSFVVLDEAGGRHTFDQLILASSARDAEQMLRGVAGASEMRAAVGRVRHFDVDIALHGDPTFMPRHRRDWAHNNVFFDGEAAWMSDWQGARQGVPVIRSWLPKGCALPEPLFERRRYHHVLMSPENARIQARIAALQGVAGLWVTGMYALDVDSHESALLSALVPARSLAPRSPNLRRLCAAVGVRAPVRSARPAVAELAAIEGENG
jgi:predicted NAD/FAD-binding protein